ncbi:MAG TPA: helix-turn-helix domain-containing protein [Tepidisphaeraceae bacterium]|jgi:ribosome-binding protein aMBF1 (putative translation factor)|nr:helix-turn-helix domain-containing protein [Tepidisphaeraceae bacterium]
MKTLTEKGQKFVMVPFDAWTRIASGAVSMPEFPEADAEGNMDALEFARTTIARGIIRDRVAAGMSQAELARRAEIQPAVLNRIEKARVVPDESTMRKIDAALRGARGKTPVGRNKRSVRSKAKSRITS